jgi:hypothetical protein
MENLHLKRQIGDDGEILAGLFCDACGDLNETGVESCQNCGAYLIDQGPDLKARLSRIRRYALTAQHQEAEQSPLSARIIAVMLFLYILLALGLLVVITQWTHWLR